MRRSGRQGISSGAEESLELSRRAFLRMAALMGGGAALAFALEACGSSGSNKTSASSSGASAPASAAASPGASSIKLAADQTFRYVDNEPVHLDPGLSTAGVEITINRQIWEPLLEFDAQNKAVPLGATSWEISPDGTIYTFHLRDGIKWTDGTAVTARDYEWTWKRNMDPKTASTYAEALYAIKGAKDVNTGKAPLDAMGVKAVDDKTLQVTLEGPAGYFLRIASTWTAFVLPRQAIEKYGDKWVEAGNAISSGPFKLDKWDHDQQIVLTRNEGYWGTKSTLSKAVVTLTTDIPKTSLPAYENNELDVSIGPWPADIDRIQGDPALSKQLHIFPNSPQFVVCDSTNTNSPVGNADFRRALYLAVDRDKIVNDVFKKVFVTSYTMLPSDILGYNPDARIPGGVNEAKASLARSGVDPKSAALTLVYSQTSTNDLLAQVLQQMWQQNLGIKVNLNAMESKAYTAYNNTLKNAHYDMKLGIWGSDYLDPFDWHNFLFTTGTDFYHAHWSNPSFDSLVGQAATLTDQDKRKQLYQQAETILIKDAAYIPLYHTATPDLIKPWVDGWVWQAVGGVKWKNIQIAQH